MLDKLFPWRFSFGRKDAAYDNFAALLTAGAATAANINVSPETALRCTPVLQAVRIRCETLGTCPILLYERKAEGGKERAVDHPLYRLVHDRPNGWTSAAEFVMALELDGLLHGAGYALANRSGEKIVELIRLQPSAVTCTVGDDYEPKYEVSLKNGTRRAYSWRDILHVPMLGSMAPVRQAREAIGLALSMEQHAGNLFGRGGRPSGILKFKKRLGDDVRGRISKSWAAAHGGGENSGRTAILEEEADFQALTFNSVDLQFQELRSFQVVEIARAFAVPPMMLMDFGRATWGNSEQMSQNFLTFGLLPRMKVWQGALSRLLSEEERKTLSPEFLVDELVRAEIAARFEAYAKAISNGILNPNEVRAMENRPPYEGGDEFRVPMNTEAPGQDSTRRQVGDESVKPTPQAKPRIVA
jgi:HK97 family phage portal protein